MLLRGGKQYLVLQSAKWRVGAKSALAVGDIVKDVMYAQSMYDSIRGTK